MARLYIYYMFYYNFFINKNKLIKNIFAEKKSFIFILIVLHIFIFVLAKIFVLAQNLIFFIDLYICKLTTYPKICIIIFLKQIKTYL